MRKLHIEGKGLCIEKMQKSLQGCISLERHPDYDNDKAAVLKWGNLHISTIQMCSGKK